MLGCSKGTVSFHCGAGQKDKYRARRNMSMSWASGAHYDDFTFTDTLFPGMWNRVQVVLSPAKSDDLEHVAIYSLTRPTTSF